MVKNRLTIGEIRTAQNNNEYSLVEENRAKGRVALLLVRNANPQSFHNLVSTIALDTWLTWTLKPGVNGLSLMTERVRSSALELLRA